MSDQIDQDDQDSEDSSNRRPPRAVVGSHHAEEKIFGRAFDGRVIRRIWPFVRPYRAKMIIAVAAVLVFTLSQIALPLTISFAIDHGMAFYNEGHLDKSTDFDSFKEKMLKPSRKHRLQYRNKDTLMTAIKSRSDGEVTEGIKKGLMMVANLEDTVLKQQAKVISNDVARGSLLAIITARRDQARCILYKSFPQDFAAYSETQWPSLSMRKAMNRSV